MLAWEERHSTLLTGIQLAAIVIGARVGGGEAVGSGPRSITGFARGSQEPFHAIDRVMGRDGHGVSDAALLDAIRNGRMNIQKNGAYQIQGRNATVVVNSSGKIITAWARNSQGWRH